MARPFSAESSGIEAEQAREAMGAEPVLRRATIHRESLDDEVARRETTILAFKADLTKLINHHSMESLAGDTPDFILAGFMTDVLLTLGRANSIRDKFFNMTKPWDPPSR